MPTIFVRLDVSLQGNDLSVQLEGQAQGLIEIGAQIADVIENPPDSLTDLGRVLDELPLPELGVSGDFAAALADVQAALPANLSAVTGDLMAGLEDFQAALETDVTGVLGDVLEAIQALRKLMELDLRCEHEEEGGAGGGGAAAGGGAAGGGGGEGEAEAQPSGVAQATTQVDAVLAILDKAPSPFDVGGALALIRELTRFQGRNAFLPIRLPFLDDWIDPLQTLSTWKEMQPGEIRGHMALTLQELEAFVRRAALGGLTGLMAGLAGHPAMARIETLARIAGDLTTALGVLREAVNAGDLSGTGEAVQTIQDCLVERASLPDLAAGLPALGERLASLPDDLEDGMSYLLSVLGPTDSFRLLDGVLPEDEEVAAEELEKIRESLEPMLGWVRDLTDKLDLDAVREPLATAVGAARSAVDGLEQGLAGVTAQVRSMFGEVESLVQDVDTQSLAEEAKDAIQGFADELEEKITDLFQPVRTAVSQVIASLGGALDSFDPAQAVTAFQDAIQAITGVLEDPEVKAALDGIRDALETATHQLEELSFAPLTDEVIAGIHEITEALRGIDTSKLDTALQLALQAALAILPEDLTPITNPFVADFGVMIDTGPVPLLEVAREQPQKLLDKVRSFDPGSLVEASLGQPYKDLLKQMKAFKPSTLLEPVKAEIDRLEDRLRQEANPGAPLELLETPFDQLLAALDTLDPEELVEPLDEAISGAVDKVLAVLPVDDVFEQVDGVLGAVEEVVAFARRVVELLEKLEALFQGLAGSRSQIEAWIDDILSKVEAMGDTSSLVPRFGQVTAALDDTRAAALTARFEATAGPLIEDLDERDLQGKLAALVHAHATFPRPALAALAGGDTIAGVLDSFDPLDPAFGAPYLALDDLLGRLREARIGLGSTLVDWDERHHAAGGLLDAFRVSGATPAELRQWVRDALEPQFIRPFQALFGVLGALGGPLSAVVGAFRELVDDLQAKVADLLLGPDSLGGIRDDLQELVDRLKAFDLGFVTESLSDVFGEVRGKLEALDPAVIREEVEAAFEEMLATLSLDLFLPPADVKKLDDDYGKVIAKLEQLDPAKLVVEVIQPEFDEHVLPLLESFDLTLFLDALIERMRSLDEELKAEMGRVNQAYQELRGAIPPLEISIDIDIDVGVSF